MLLEFALDIVKIHVVIQVPSLKAQPYVFYVLFSGAMSKVRLLVATELNEKNGSLKVMITVVNAPDERSVDMLRVYE